MKDRRWLLWGLGALVLGALVLVCGGALATEAEPLPPAAPQLQATYWDSGWVEIAQGEILTLTHNLGGDPALYGVDLIFRDTRPEAYGVHQRAYGGMGVGTQLHGANWQNLTAQTISIHRQINDAAIAQVRVRLWRPDPPAYDSDWQNMRVGNPPTLTHGLGGDVDSYVTGIKFRDTQSLGIHQFAFGGLSLNQQYYGAVWEHLTNNTVEVWRLANDVTTDFARLMIEIADPPAYDSGWVQIARGATRAFTHALGGDPQNYLVRLAERSAIHGISIWGMGGFELGGGFQGVNWENLTDQEVRVFRRPQDTFADSVRVRIWQFNPPTSCVPSLVAPAPGAIMDNGRTDFRDEEIWDFDWADCPGATHYHLYVIGPTATLPTVDDDHLTESSYHFVNRGYVSASHLTGWTWRVRAEVDGVWGAWSETRTFDVEPADTDPPSTCVPALISPAAGAIMDNGRPDGLERLEWKFEWGECPEATRYNLYVTGGGLPFPMIDSTTTTPLYRLSIPGYLAETQLTGWTWRVRAEEDGVWGEWSEERPFTVEPPSSDPLSAFLPLILNGR